jgi:hypothetical protein
MGISAFGFSEAISFAPFNYIYGIQALAWHKHKLKFVLLVSQDYLQQEIFYNHILSKKMRVAAFKPIFVTFWNFNHATPRLIIKFNCLRFDILFFLIKTFQITQ